MATASRRAPDEVLVLHPLPGRDAAGDEDGDDRRRRPAARRSTAHGSAAVGRAGGLLRRGVGGAVQRRRALRGRAVWRVGGADSAACAWEAAPTTGGESSPSSATR